MVQVQVQYVSPSGTQRPTFPPNLTYEVFAWDQSKCNWGHDTVGGCAESANVDDEDLRCKNYERLKVDDNTFNLGISHASRTLALRIRHSEAESTRVGSRRRDLAYCCVDTRSINDILLEAETSTDRHDEQHPDDGPLLGTITKTILLVTPHFEADGREGASNCLTHFTVEARVETRAKRLSETAFVQTVGHIAGGLGSLAYKGGSYLYNREWPWQKGEAEE